MKMKEFVKFVKNQQHFIHYQQVIINVVLINVPRLELEKQEKKHVSKTSMDHHHTVLI